MFTSVTIILNGFIGSWFSKIIVRVIIFVNIIFAYTWKVILKVITSLSFVAWNYKSFKLT